MSIDRAVLSLQPQDGVGVELKETESTSFHGKEKDIERKEIRLTTFNKLILSLFGKTRVGSESRRDWKAVLPLYAFKCPKHGIQITYPSGWQKTLQCPECIHELINKKPRKHRKNK